MGNGDFSPYFNSVSKYSEIGINTISQMKEKIKIRYENLWRKQLVCLWIYYDFLWLFWNWELRCPSLAETGRPPWLAEIVWWPKQTESEVFGHKLFRLSWCNVYGCNTLGYGLTGFGSSWTSLLNVRKLPTNYNKKIWASYIITFHNIRIFYYFCKSSLFMCNIETGWIKKLSKPLNLTW